MTTLPASLNTLRLACAQTDGGKLQEVAHGLRRIVADVCAEPIREAALRLKEMGTQDDLDNYDTVLAELEFHLRSLQPFVKATATDQG